MSGWCKPPHNIEFFLGALFASAKQNRAGGRPALYLVGRVLGKHEKYRDAPKPIAKGLGPAKP
jgi:hypothetical protein